MHKITIFWIDCLEEESYTVSDELAEMLVQGDLTNAVNISLTLPNGAAIILNLDSIRKIEIEPCPNDLPF